MTLWGLCGDEKPAPFQQSVFTSLVSVPCQIMPVIVADSLRVDLSVSQLWQSHSQSSGSQIIRRELGALIPAFCVGFVDDLSG